MKVISVVAIAVAVMAAVTMPNASAGAPKKCSWVRSDAIVGQPWSTEQGLCKVTISGNHFEAVLYDEISPDWVRFKIAGSITGDQLAVKVETENSDAGLDDFTGKLKKSPWNMEVIVLSDTYNMIGIKLDSN